MKKLKKNLVIGGGGIKGLSFLGALDVIFKYYPLENFENFCGVSIGSMIIIFLNIGYTIDELKDFFINNDLYNFTDYKLSNIIDSYGLDKGIKITNLLKAFLKTKNIDYNITFKDFFIKTKKNIYICGSNISKNRVDYFSHFNNPDMPILEAIRISISVPLIFSPVKYNNDYYVDGVFFEHYPIEPFKNDINNTVSVLLDISKTNEITNFESYLYRLMLSMANFNALRRLQINNNVNLYNILNDENNGLKFDLNNQDKIKLFEMGNYSIKNIIINKIYNKIKKRIYFNKLLNN